MDQDTADAISKIEKQMAERDDQISALSKAIGALILRIARLERAMTAFVEELK